MPKFSSQYKQSRPTMRVVSGENTYENGMYFTDQEVKAGFVHTLLNLEVNPFNHVVQVAGGLHTTDVAPGCTYYDTVTTIDSDTDNTETTTDPKTETSKPVTSVHLKVDRRNEHLLEAFEGVTNIISVEKLSVKDHRALAQQVRQQGYAPKDVVCYKILTYNPINYRVMVVTLLQTQQDEVYSVSPEFKLRRIYANPVSEGLAEQWQISGSANNEPYLSNMRSNVEDYYIPRVRRKRFDTTFGRRLYSPHHMQTLAHCEGFGNKTFLFMNKAMLNKKFPTVQSQKLSVTDYIILSDVDLESTEDLNKGHYVLTHETSSEEIRVYISKVHEYSISGDSHIEGVKLYQEIKLLDTPENRRALQKGVWETSSGSPTVGIKVIVNAAGVHSQIVRGNRSGYGYTVRTMSYIGSQNFEVGDFIWIFPKEGLLAYEYPQVIRVSKVDSPSGAIKEALIVSPGLFERLPPKSGVQYATNSLLGSLEGGEETYKGTVNTGAIFYNPSYDVYIRNCATGEYNSYLQIWKGEAVPVDAYKYGRALTSIGIVRRSEILGGTDMSPEAGGTYQVPAKVSSTPSEDLKEDGVVLAVKEAGRADPGIAVAGIKINLNTGELKVTSSVEFTFGTLEPLRNTHQWHPLNPENHTGIPEDPLPAGRLFEVGKLFVKDKWFHPAEFLRKPILESLRAGQAFRIAVYAKSAEPFVKTSKYIKDPDLINRLANTLPATVWVADYTWNGNDWDFNFLDTDKDWFDKFEPWEALPHTREATGQRITRPSFTYPRLTYIDFPSEHNDKYSAEHLIGPVDYGADQIKPYEHFDIEPRELMPSEAAKWGYNMLAPAPYLFHCPDTPASPPLLRGVLLMDYNNAALLNPLVNTPGMLHVYYSADQASMLEPLPETPTKDEFQMKVEYKGLNDDWVVLKEYSVEDTRSTLASGKPFIIPFTSPYEIVLIRARISDLSSTVLVAGPDDTRISVPLVVSEMPATLSYERDPSKAPIKPEVFDLGTALGMTYWKSRLVAWGIEGAEERIFMSEVSQPEYWPFPNGIDVFEESVIHVAPHGDSLIVFTTTKVWRLDLNPDGLSWTKSLLQHSLRMTDRDVPYITPIKNMLFFKADKQFYLVVPQRGSTAGELTIAPISRPIAELLSDPFKNIAEILPMDLHPLVDAEKPFDEYLVKYGTHVEQLRVFVNWWFDLTAFKLGLDPIEDYEIEHEDDRAKPKVPKVGEDGTDSSEEETVKEYWLVQLVYDTLTYGWSLRTHTTNKIGTFVTDAANENTDFVSLLYSPGNSSENSADSYANTWGISIANRKAPNDRTFTEISLSPESPEKSDYTVLKPTYKRSQVFDTGYKEVSSPSLTKRFRETQFFLQPKEGYTEPVSLGSFKTNTDTEITNLIDFGTDSELKDEFSDYLPQMDEAGSSDMSPVGEAVAMKLGLDVFVDGNDLLRSFQALPRFLCDKDKKRLNIHIHEKFNLFDPVTSVPAELSNTFTLDKSALDGVKLIRLRQPINGKGQLIRSRLTNLTEANYAILGHAFVSHNKNAR